MVTRIQRDALESDLAAARALLASLGDRDKLTAVSLRNRVVALEQELSALASDPGTVADIALVFDGGPVRGSSAIDADFAGKALQDYQELLSKHVALTSHGGLAAKGPIQHAAQQDARMNVTALVHGSFGFVLQENRSDEPQFFPSATVQAAKDVSALLSDIASTERVQFEDRLAQVDSRIFAVLRRFVGLLHKANATLRIADKDEELRLSSEKVGVAWERLQNTDIEEFDENVTGELLGLVPIQRRFDFRRDDNGEYVSGRVSETLSAEYLERIEREGIVAGKRWQATIRTKTVHRVDGRPATITHILTDLLKRE